jgi:hypothetical protein
VAVYYNLKGTTVPYFQIGKNGATLYPSDADPTGTYTVSDGDFWFDTSLGELKVRLAGAWEYIVFGNIAISGNTISSTNTNGDINIVPNGAGDVVVGNDNGGPTEIVAPDDTNFIIEAGLGTGVNDGADLFLRAGDTGSGSEGTVTFDRGGILVGAATGGDQGTGTVNAEGLFVNGVPVQRWTNVVTATSRTSAAWERNFVTAATQTITLPITPADGTEVIVSVVGTFTDTVIARNGQNIMGLAENMTVDQPNVTVHLVYVNSTLGWRVI